MEDRINRHFKYLVKHGIPLYEYISQHTILANRHLSTQKKKKGRLYWTPRGILVRHPTKKDTTIMVMYNIKFSFTDAYLQDIHTYRFPTTNVVFNHHPLSCLICSKVNLFQKILQHQKKTGLAPYFLQFVPTYRYPQDLRQFQKKRKLGATYCLKKDIDRKEGITFLYPGEDISQQQHSDKEEFLIQEFVTQEKLFQSPVNHQYYKINFRFFVALEATSNYTKAHLFHDAFAKYTALPYSTERPFQLQAVITAYPIESSRNTMAYHRSLKLPTTWLEASSYFTPKEQQYLLEKVGLLVDETVAVYGTEFQTYHQDIDQKLKINSSSFHLYALDVGITRQQDGSLEPILYEWNSNPWVNQDHRSEQKWMKTVQDWWMSVV